MRFCYMLSVCIILTCLQAEEKQFPLFKDFMGINGHYHFKAELYKPTCRLVRNYHNINWDVTEIGNPITIPVCANKVHWKNNLYGAWKRHGLETDICLMFGSHGFGKKGYIEKWEANMKWAYDYGFKVAEYFGPSGKEKLCTSVEIGNEPGRRFDQDLYVKIFKQMAQGLRDADPKLKIVTATAHARAADDYSLDLRKTYSASDVLPLFDVINVHTYAQIERKNNSESPWNRSYPEDPSLAYLKVVDETITWRDEKAPEKEIWVTEFGYDCVTPDAMKKRKDWALKLDWQGTTDLQQAQYVLRSFFLFAERGIDRAYIYFFDDKNEPRIHAAAGLTRNSKPKQSYWAVKQCYERLGDYRFSKIIRKDKQAYVYEFKHGSDADKTIWMAWSPTGVETHKKEGYQPKSSDITLTKLPAAVQGVYAMATRDAAAKKVEFSSTGKRTLQLTVTESPCYIEMDGSP